MNDDSFVKEILNSKEDIHLEFKKSKTGLSRSFWETYSSFANTDGGIVVLGIEENNPKNNIVGVEKPEVIKNTIFKEANNKDVVNINLLMDSDVLIKNYMGNSIVIIHIPEASPDQKPVFLKNKIDNTYIRRGECDQKADSDTIKYFMMYSHSDIDSQLLNNYDMSDIDTNTIDLYLSELNSSVTRIDSSKGYKNILIELGALRKDRTENNKYKLTAGGLLFFGKYNSIRDRFPHFQLDYYRYTSDTKLRWIDKVSTGDMEYPNLNLFSFYKIVLDKLTVTTEDRFMLDDNEQRRLPFRSDLREAVREAFVNTLMHAYYDSDRAIKIEDCVDYYSFFNPGAMKVTEEEFFKGGISKTSNELIATLFRRIGASEKSGSGGKKIADIAMKYKLRWPEVKLEYNNTTIKLWKEDLISTLDLTPEEQQVMEYMMQALVATKSEIMKKLALTQYQARVVLESLVKRKLLTLTSEGRSSKYLLNMNSQNALAAMKRTILKIFD